MSSLRSICKFDLNCICVFVFLYLHVRNLGTLFPKSSYYYLFKNISPHRSIWSFDPNCICIFVYLHLCIWVSDTWEHCFCQKLFEVLVPFPFQKYITSWVFSGFSCSRAISGLDWVGMGWVGLGSLCGAIVWAPLCGANNIIFHIVVNCIVILCIVK